MEIEEEVGRLMADMDVIKKQLAGPVESHCVAHSGQTEKMTALETKIADRLTLFTWIIGIGIVVIVSSISYLATASSSTIRIVTQIDERQQTVQKKQNEFDRRQDTLEERVNGYEKKLLMDNFRKGRQ